VHGKIRAERAQWGFWGPSSAGSKSEGRSPKSERNPKSEFIKLTKKLAVCHRVRPSSGAANSRNSDRLALSCAFFASDVSAVGHERAPGAWNTARLPKMFGSRNELEQR